MNVSDDTLWLLCTNCRRKLAKVMYDGRYESKSRNFCVEIVIGTVICPRCGRRHELPPGKDWKPTKGGRKDAERNSEHRNARAGNPAGA